jgi:HK97 family phage major capsid protein
LFAEARSILGMETRAALTTTDIPLPIEYFGEIRELISEFGVARRNMFPFPIGLGTAKPPRFKTRPAFGSIAMSASIAEKSPQIDFATLESHKIGGIVRVPRELDEQSIVPMGQFLARYGAVEFARAEDNWAFLADGSANYETVKGITKVATDNSKNVQLLATKTKPSDATLGEFRAMRLKVNPAALSRGAKYYLHSTWETRLRDFNTGNDLFAFVPNRPSTRDAIGGPTLDGYPIVWTDVLEPYSTNAAASKYLAVFGALDYWWFGEHGNPRLDFSSDVYFATDEMAARFLEEIDFDYQDLGATASLQTAAS